MSEELFDSTDAVAEFQAMMQDPAARQAFVELKAERARDGTRARYSHIVRLVAETPWAITRPMLAVIIDLLAFRVAGGRLDPEEINARIGGLGRAAPATPPGVAVLPLHGVIVPRADAFSQMSGGTSIDKFRGMFREAVAAADVSGIVLDVDSPGGMVDGVPEMAAEMRAARGSKPIVAVANTEMASGAYWLASQADQIVVSKSARVGSIGVYTAHEDRSAEEAAQGVKTTLISAGKYKTEGNPFEPLTDEARAHLQTMVDEYYGMFVSDVAKGRGANVSDVRGGFGEGHVVGARDALKNGMADRVGTVESVVGEMLTRPVAAAALTSSTASMTFSNPNAALTADPGSAVQLGTVSIPIMGSVDVSGAEFEAAVDSSAWDGNRAMTECKSAADYKQICAGEHTVGQPTERQHWALPHHYLGQGPNAAGTQAALQNLPRTQNLSNKAAAQTHLETHMAEINPDYTPSGASNDEMLQASAELALLAEDPVLSE